jgi:hypothetical protein
MTDARWADIDADLVAAETHFSAAITLLEGGALDAEGFEGYTRRMAFLHAMQAGHTSVEAALRRLLLALGEPLPEGPDWHAVLIRRAAQEITGARPAVLSEPLAAAMQETRGFRHVAAHVYDEIRPSGARLAADAARVVLAKARPEFEAFWKKVGGNG